MNEECYVVKGMSNEDIRNDGGALMVLRDDAVIEEPETTGFLHSATNS